MSNLKLYQQLDLYALVTDINESSNDTYSFIGLSNNNVKYVFRLDNNINIEKGSIYHIKGVAKEYKTKVHIYVDSLILLNDEDISMEEKEKVLNDLTGNKNVDINYCINYIENEINSISNETLNLITKTIYDDYKNIFIEYPAATKFHHPYRHGLLFHTYNSLRVGKAIAQIYPNISLSLVVAGLILHDMMKTKEIKGFDSEYTLDGKMFGHITLGVMEVNKYAIKLGIEEKEEIKMLEHIILSHHCEPEFGAPKRPQIIEALVCHIADACDAKVEPTIEMLEKTEYNELSEPVAVNDKMKFYKHNIR